MFAMPGPGFFIITVARCIDLITDDIFVFVQPRQRRCSFILRKLEVDSRETFSVVKVMVLALI